MTLSGSIRHLADVVDGLAEDGVDVVDVTVPHDEQATENGVLRADLTVAIPVAGESAAETTTAPETARQSTRIDGTLEATSEDDAAPTGDADADGGPSGDTDAAEDEPFACPEPDCTARFESEPGLKIHRTKVHRSAAGSGGDDGNGPPAYADPDALAEVYESHETFREMRDALDVDVSVQTVRRKLIEHGFHDPEAATEGDPGTGVESAESDGTATAKESVNAVDTEESDETAATDLPLDTPLTDVVPESVDAPADRTIGDLKAGVESADTLYHLQRQFECDRETLREVLDALDLLELVHGRVATRSQREELKAEIDERIRHNLNGASA